MAALEEQLAAVRKVRAAREEAQASAFNAMVRALEDELQATRGERDAALHRLERKRGGIASAAASLGASSRHAAARRRRRRRRRQRRGRHRRWRQQRRRQQWRRQWRRRRAVARDPGARAAVT